MSLPLVIQGGMGIGVSAWCLARAVAEQGQLGVVSGTALDAVLVRRLQCGDPGGHLRRALEAFPFPRIADEILSRYYCDPGGSKAGSRSRTHSRFALAPMLRSPMPLPDMALLVAANFVEVFLAKNGLEKDAVETWQVGINYLEKIQAALLPSLYGAMLAGVDVVLVGAGIPDEIPNALDHLARHEPTAIKWDVLDAGDTTYELRFDPTELWLEERQARPSGNLRRPAFLPIVSAATLARALLKKSPDGIDGFVVESHDAGGHNAPPRGGLQLTASGEPQYGPRDIVVLEQMRALGKPFWLAGGQASAAQLAAARAAGAAGIQVGTMFAFCEESGLDPSLKQRFLAELLRHDERSSHLIFTDPEASPTGYPFKVIQLEGTLSEDSVYAQRTRICDLGFLRRAYRGSDGLIHYRCPGEPVADYLRKGGNLTETHGKKCLCNALLANLGLGQCHDESTGVQHEPPLLTAGSDVACIIPLISPDRLTYHARDALDLLLTPSGSSVPPLKDDLFFSSGRNRDGALPQGHMPR